MACLVASADCAVIYPYHAHRKAYDQNNISSFGLRHEFTPSDKPREYGKSVAARIIRQPTGMCALPDVAQDTEWGSRGKTLRESKFIAREKIKAFVGIRLDFGNEPVGVLFVNFRTPHHFAQEELEPIRLLANQAAVAISNARLYGRTSEKLAQKVDELRTVGEINELITSTLDLDEVLPLILDKAMELLNVQNGILQLVDDDTGELVIQWCKAPLIVPLRQPRLSIGEGVTGKAALEKRSIIVDDVTRPPWRDIYREFWPETRSELAVLLLIGEDCIGVLNLEHPERGFFSEDEREIIEGLAAQAAVAIENARLYDAVKRRSEHLRALHEASKAITAGFAADRNHVLDRIAEQAVERITGVKGPKAVSATILLYDETAHELRLESVYPPSVLSDFESKLGGSISLDKDSVPAARTGIVGRALLEGKAQRVGDVKTDPDYIEFDARTKSELDVPLLDGDKIIGVLSVESDHTGAFDEDDEQALQGLADLAVIGIKSAEQVDRLKRTDAVALMGAWGADVAHDVNREVGAIRRAAFVLQRRADLADEVKERLRDIDRYASRLALPELPEQAPESGRVLEFLDAPFLDNVIRAEVQDLQPVHPSVTLRLEQNCEDIRVAIHERWLRRLLRHLIHNAAKTFPSDKETRLVTVRTAVRGPMAEIQVEDTGHGIQQDVLPKLFQRPVPHKDGRPGRGLLLVRFLAEQHGGYAKLVWSQPGEGACFCFGIPLAQPATGSVST
jgi:GAF domain-containing protein